MTLLPSLFVSLLLAALLSFATPIFLVGIALAVLSVVSVVPGFTLFGQTSAIQIREFLAIFGSGGAIQGILTIALTCSIVGTLFDLFNFYRYQALRVQ